MMTRMLPPEEWHRLIGTEVEHVWPHLDSRHAQVIVVEDDGVIVGTWALFHLLHAECLWIAPTHRGKASVARRLWAQLIGLTQAMGITSVATAAISDDVRALLAHVKATKLEGDHYIMRMPCQPQ
jgi:ribosomal protein S18 acetylase RimI-like enzyme